MEKAFKPAISLKSTSVLGRQTKRRGKTYGKVNIKDNAKAILGDNNGQIIQQLHYHITTQGSAIDPRFATRVERQNEILPLYTLETITTFQDGGPIGIRGTSSKTVLRWKRAEDLGEGIFGEVHRETQKDNATFPSSRAVKVMRRRQLTRMKIDYKRELGAMIKLAREDYNHYFVEFYTWYEHAQNVYIAMEYIPNGDLSRYIVAGIPSADIEIILGQVLDALCILHRLDIVHRDIKPANIFVVTTAPNWWVKVGDFGICKNTITQHTALYTNVGTDGYQAPEIVLASSKEVNHYDAKCDIWSLGCLAYELRVGHVPFPSFSELHYFCNCPDNQRLDWLEQSLVEFVISAKVHDLISKLLDPEPHKRPSAQEALEFFGDFRNKDDGLELVTTSSHEQVQVKPNVAVSNGSAPAPTSNLGTWHWVDFRGLPTYLSGYTAKSVCDYNPARASRIMHQGELLSYFKGEIFDILNGPLNEACWVRKKPMIGGLADELGWVLCEDLELMPKQQTNSQAAELVAGKKKEESSRLADKLPKSIDQQNRIEQGCDKSFTSFSVVKNGHHFRQVVGNMSKCAYCESKILGKTGMQCKDCWYNSHLECISNISNSCWEKPGHSPSHDQESHSLKLSGTKKPSDQTFINNLLKENGHCFIKQVSGSVARCALCTREVLGTSGMQCKDCQYHWHLECIPKISISCAGMAGFDLFRNNKPHCFKLFLRTGGERCHHCRQELPVKSRFINKCQGCGMMTHLHCEEFVSKGCQKPSLLTASEQPSPKPSSYFELLRSTSWIPVGVQEVKSN